jgi:hypothetical protein
MTDSRRPRRKSREERAQRRKETTRTFWEARFSGVDRPQDLVQENWAMLQAAFAKLERQASARVDRAKAPQQKAEAAAQLAATRERIMQVCSTAATQLAELADDIRTERR